MPTLNRIIAIGLVSTSLASCSPGDIIVKTDLDEKYIVKESAVTTPPLNWEEKVKYWRGVAKDYGELLAMRESAYLQCFSGPLSLSEATCLGIYKDGIEDTKKKLAESKERLAATLKYQAGGEHPASSIRYRPIFVDVNNEKNAMGYVSLTCLNPELSKEEGDKVFSVLELTEDQVEKKSTPRKDAYTAVSLEVCKRYAYQKANRFSFSIDDDQSKDKADK